MVNENVLIPRPETELLVEKIIENLKEYENPKILDIGCGSGAIALALKNQIKNSYVIAIDISQSAIDVAKRNAILNNLDVKFIQSDLYENVNKKYDIIVSNPPYIAYNEEVDSIVLENEPHSALFATNDGLYFYEQILKSAYLYLNFPSVIGFEIPYNKNDELIYLCNQYFPKQKYEIIKDLNNKSRILIIKNYWR
jgi:release factor glutamine methyltransferase